MICADGKAEAAPRSRSMSASFVTVWPRLAATATASSAVSRSIASHTNDHRNLRTSSSRLRERSDRSSALDTRLECSLSIASTRRSKKRRRRGGTEEQPVHRRCQPYHAQMIAEGGRRTHRLTVNPAAAAGRAVFIPRRIDAGAERGKPERALDFGGNGPGTVALVVGDILQRGPPQASSRREKTRSPRGNWFRQRRSAPPAPRDRRGSARFPRHNCENASAPAVGCGEGVISKLFFFVMPGLVPGIHGSSSD